MVPVDGGARPVEADEVESDVRVGRAGGGIANGRGHPIGVSGIGDHPFPDGGGVDPTHSEGVTVRAPPVSAKSPHLLRGDEVGAAPGDGVGFAVADQHP